MSANGLEVFDKTVQTTNIWLNEIAAAIGPDRHLAWKVLSVVLHKLRDRLPIDLAAHLGAELPLLIRGVYYDQFQPARQPSEFRHMADFAEEVGKWLSDARPVGSMEAIDAVFATLSRHVPKGQIRKLQEALPRDIRAHWQALEENIVPPPELGEARRAGGGAGLDMGDLAEGRGLASDVVRAEQAPPSA